MVENIYRGLIGILFLISVCYLLSNNRKAIDWKLVLSGIGIQLLFGLLVLKTPGVYQAFSWVSGFFVKIIEFTDAGATFVLGKWPALTQVVDGDNNTIVTVGFVFAFKVLPTILFFSALTSVLYFLGILQKIVWFFAWIMSKTMRMSGAESLSASANIFIGQTEAPLLIKPYLSGMTKSEMLCVMTGGMATIAGGVMAAYIQFLGGDDPVQQQIFATHLLAASVMSAPAAVVASKMLFPQTENVDKTITVGKEKIGVNVLDALSNGTTDGLKLAANVGAMLITFIAAMAMLNYFCHDLIGEWTGLNKIISDNSDYDGLTLQYLFGQLFAPVAWLIGTPSVDIFYIGQLLGEKTIINEFVAYGSLGNLKESGLIENEKSIIIATYALCGFSNFSSIGIQIGGIGALAPNQRANLASLGIKALIGGTVACFLTASIAGMLS
ncbi:MAG: NupC/NupG family nucleoside CNT transporter [Chitinophagales bacterium]|nr:hypothetical protein [Bacteroidota bacterium]MBP7399134.1 NupC/NupG family nucleoside CNT transporter [Chitinophagales bacterium]MBP8753220.1 NupC/NupG family nucleoside CNT transporter [Chitinophagales bacterium]MBP9188856.1 NupC/NupG family nucleoside CNT transporter [Chitinophagales bacterium]MBP9703342.1 NupC/NupG family nucleoside CNT transporter [Chitinophagales bacterium]